MSDLAINGGPPVRGDPLPDRRHIGREECDAAARVLERAVSGAAQLGRYAGEEVDTLEREWARYHGVRFATAVSSGTAAVHTALAAARFDGGGEVITPPVTDPGGVNPILFQHLIPVFADMDPDTFNVTPDAIEARITPRTCAIIAVHLAGQPCDMDPIMRIAEQHGLLVIEDCSQAHGARYRGHLCGTIGHMAAFSLMSGKHLTAAGEGGIVMTNDESLYHTARSFADKGKGFEREDPRNWLLGLNYRLTEIQAAVARVQLTRLDDIVRRRRALCESLRTRMADLRAVRFWRIIEGAEPSYWFCFLRLELDRVRASKEDFARAVSAEGIPIGAHYAWLLYDFPCIRERRTFGGSAAPWSCYEHARDLDYTDCCPGAEEAIRRHMTAFVHESWTEREIEHLVTALHKVEQHYIR